MQRETNKIFIKIYEFINFIYLLYSYKTNQSREREREAERKRAESALGPKRKGKSKKTI